MVTYISCLFFNIPHKGDSGGGLVKDNVVFGVLSSSFDVVSKGHVDEYTIVWPHLEWIILALNDELSGGICVI